MARDDKSQRPAGKLFGVGLSRTGTTSLTKALQALGVRARHFPLSDREVAHFEALTDVSIACQFERLDRMYPGSRFIYTVRERESWVASVQAFFEGQRNALAKMKHPAHRVQVRAVRRAMFGTEQPETLSRAQWLALYEAHDARVRAHFADRPEALLAMDVVGGQGWEVLVPFVAPWTRFPHTNAKPT